MLRGHLACHLLLHILSSLIPRAVGSGASATSVLGGSAVIPLRGLAQRWKAEAFLLRPAGCLCIALHSSLRQKLLTSP